MNRGRFALGDVEQTTADRVDELVQELVAARQRRALSQRRLSILLGLNKLVVGRWEAQIDIPFLLNFVRWAQFLGYHVTVLDPSGKPITPHVDPLHGEPLACFEARRITLALKTARVDAGFTRRSLGTELGVSHRSVLFWETARRDPRLLHLLDWAERLGCRVELQWNPADASPAAPDEPARTQDVAEAL
jgi:transcriptional regulator with XRE-family HTH domain